MNTERSDPAVDELAPLLLHGVADDTQRATLAQLLTASSGNRRRFLEHTALHSQLAQAAKAGQFSGNPAEFFHALERPPVARPRRILKFWLPAAAAVIAACLVAIPLLPASASAALDRVIVAAKSSPDRCYRIEVLEPADPETNESRSDRGRFPAANHLEGATLWLRSPGQFVLRQTLPNGETRFLGSDGNESWSRRGQGTSRVSDDPERFGGGLVAKRREIGFLDLDRQLDELKPLYQIEWLDRSNHDLWKLRGTRRSADQGGAREIELWFSPDSGLLQRMVLRQLPRGNGGPRSIALDLQSTAPLPDDFFNSTHPHTTSP